MAAAAVAAAEEEAGAAMERAAAAASACAQAQTRALPAGSALVCLGSGAWTLIGGYGAAGSRPWATHAASAASTAAVAATARWAASGEDAACGGRCAAAARGTAGTAGAAGAAGAAAWRRCGRLIGWLQRRGAPAGGCAELLLVLAGSSTASSSAWRAAGSHATYRRSPKGARGRGRHRWRGAGARHGRFRSEAG